MKQNVKIEEIAFIIAQDENVASGEFANKVNKKVDLLVKLFEKYGVKIDIEGKPNVGFLMDALINHKIKVLIENA